MRNGRWDRVKALFDRIVDQATQTGDAILDAPGESPSVVQEARALRDADARAQDFLRSGIAAEQEFAAGHCVSGRFHILEVLGRGGMGVVYRAQDAVLSRQVALKFLDFGGAETLESLMREARAAASLVHPNICVIHEIVVDHQPPFIVMELLEGQTLRRRAAGKPVPLRLALGWAIQIADGLAAAHARGLVHRDLKPENVMVARTGQVKILDFGLAGRPGSEAAAASVHFAMGTAGYMSPEQESGASADHRSDLFGFGTLLHELLSGGKGAGGTLPASVPPALAAMIGRCLESEPDRRFQSAADLAFAMRSLTDAAGRAARAAHWGRAIWAVAGVLAIGLGIAGWGWWSASRRDEPALVRLDVDLGAGVVLRPPDPNEGVTSSVSISPDGTRLAYIAVRSGGPSRLLIRRLDQAEDKEVPGSDGARFAFFSPDGTWVGFATDAKVCKASVEGSAVMTIGSLIAYGASWAEDGGIWLDGAAPSGLVRVASNGQSASLTALGGGEMVHGYPHVLPDGKSVLFTVYHGGPNVDNATIEVATFPGGRRKPLIRGGATARYLPLSKTSGYVLYNHRSTLMAVPFDLKGLETRGPAVPVLDGLMYEEVAGAGHFDVSRTGTLVYRKQAGAATPRSVIQWLDHSGKTQPLLARAGSYADAKLSPDGERLAFTASGGQDFDIWVYSARRDTMTRLTSGGPGYLAPVWSPDGRYIAFGAHSSGLLVARSDGSLPPQPLLSSSLRPLPGSFSPDGKHLAYFQKNDESGSARQILTVSVVESGGRLIAGKPEAFLKNEFDNILPIFSPDGRWLASVSNETGEYEVYVRAFPRPPSGEVRRWQVSSGGGFSPMWSKVRRELLFQSGDKVMAVHYEVEGESFVSGTPRVWAAVVRGAEGLGLSPDGQRVAAAIPEAYVQPSTNAREVTIVFHFDAKLRGGGL